MIPFLVLDSCFDAAFSTSWECLALFLGVGIVGACVWFREGR